MSGLECDDDSDKMTRMNQSFTAIIKQDDGWWIGWIEEVSGVNSQGKTRAELVANCVRHCAKRSR